LKLELCQTCLNVNRQVSKFWDSYNIANGSIVYLYEALEKSRKAALEAIASFSTGNEKRRHTRMVNRMLKPYDINPKKLRRNIAQGVIELGRYEF